MDVDGGNTEGPSPQSSNDIDTSFLQQFSCLGTTDHDELVSQLQKILGNQLNYATARFFLDMNNWNLQAAVGCYFDFNSGQKLPSMKILADVTVGEGEGVTPNTNFIQSWKIQNSGDEVWPYGCYLKCTSHPNETEIPINCTLQPGEETVISVNLVSPATLGSFQTKWRLCTSYGSYFGDIMWLIVQVTESGTLALTQQLSALQTTNNIGGGSGGAMASQPENSMSMWTADVSAANSMQLVGPINTGAMDASGGQQQTMEASQQPLPDDSEMW